MGSQFGLEMGHSMADTELEPNDLAEHFVWFQLDIVLLFGQTSATFGVVVLYFCVAD